MSQKILFLFLFLFFAKVTLFAQILLPLKKAEFSFKSPIGLQVKDTVRTISPSMLVSPTFYCSNLAFFCKKEIKIEKVTKIPFRFRLGSVQYVDYLEGKQSVVGGR
jgi:hypothetical protein